MLVLGGVLLDVCAACPVRVAPDLGDVLSCAAWCCRRCGSRRRSGSGIPAAITQGLVTKPDSNGRVIGPRWLTGLSETCLAGAGGESSQWNDTMLALVLVAKFAAHYVCVVCGGRRCTAWWRPRGNRRVDGMPEPAGADGKLAAHEVVRAASGRGCRYGGGYRP